MREGGREGGNKRKSEKCECWGRGGGGGGGVSYIAFWLAG